MKSKCHTEAVCDFFDPNNYITDYSAIPSQIEEIQNRNKIILLRQALVAKFDSNTELQALLTLNPSKTMTYLYAEHKKKEFRKDDVIGIGNDGTGKNMTGGILASLRADYLKKQTEIVKLNTDIAVLSHLFNNDQKLLGWFYSRAFDIVNTVVLLFISTSHSRPQTGIGMQDLLFISGQYILDILHYLYSSCDVQFNELIELEVPLRFFDLIHQEFDKKFRSYTNLGDSGLPARFSDDAIIQIWRYCSFLTYSLLLEGAKYKQKSLHLYLSNIILNLTMNENVCPVKIEKSRSPCIVSAIVNIVKSIILILAKPIDIHLVNFVANIIIGELVDIPNNAAAGNTFDNIQVEYPILSQYFTGAGDSSSDTTDISPVISRLNIIYDFIEARSFSQPDVTKVHDTDRLKNRINFFSSIPIKPPQSMLPDNITNDTSISDTSSDSMPQLDQDAIRFQTKLLAALKIHAELGPIDVHDVNGRPGIIGDTQLQPRKHKQPELIKQFGPDTQPPPSIQAILDNQNNQIVMDALNEEFDMDDLANRVEKAGMTAELSQRIGGGLW